MKLPKPNPARKAERKATVQIVRYVFIAAFGYIMGQARINPPPWRLQLLSAIIIFSLLCLVTICWCVMVERYRSLETHSLEDRYMLIHNLTAKIEEQRISDRPPVIRKY